MEPERNDVPQILQKRITVDSHKRDNCQRKQRHGHNNDPDCRGHGDPHQLRIADQHYQEYSFDGIACLHHATKELTGICIVGRNGIDITVFLFFHKDTLQQVFRNNGNVQNVIGGNVENLVILVANHEQIVG